MRRSKVQKIVLVSLMAAMGLVLQFVAIPFPFFSFLKIDFSDVPIMVAMFLFGPLAGIVTAGLRSLLHLVITGIEPSNIVGDVASFVASCSFTLPLYYFFHSKASTKGASIKNKILGTVTGTLLMTLVMSVANYFVITPLYLKFFNMQAESFLGMSLARYVAVGIVPFNLAKGLIVSIVFVAIYAKLLPWLITKTVAVPKKREDSLNAPKQSK
ncbi:ECF transporter S component [Enterococcus nangangensis]|uniref:ECF transporter S component n=1 Tax=Enterococcus nangangensis TaxID=2559926 RepID=UPI0010F5441D|nr:ECF transporter S component [Enterococcus nangangensis]